MPTLSDLQFPPLTSIIFFCFSNHQGSVFLFFLLFSLPSSVLQWHHEEGNLFLEYDKTNLLFYTGYYKRNILFSHIRSKTSFATFSDHSIFSVLLQHPISRLSRHFLSNFCRVQVPAPYKSMFQTNFFPSSMFSLLIKRDRVIFSVKCLFIHSNQSNI